MTNGQPPTSPLLKQQPAVGVPTHSSLTAAMGTPMHTRVPSVVTTLVLRDGRFLFPEVLSRDSPQRDSPPRGGKLSRDEVLMNVIAELNATALQYGPNRKGARKALGYMPLVNIAAHLTWRSQFKAMKKQLQRTCAEINDASAASGGGSGRRVKLLYREVPWESANAARRPCGPGSMLAQVEVQVLGA